MNPSITDPKLIRHEPLPANLATNFATNSTSTPNPNSDSYSFHSTTFQRKSGATFIQKLSSMLNTSENKGEESQSICWSNDGLSFIIFDLDNFVKKTLPLYFKHDKFQSFVRQLNMYGFHKKNRLPRRKNQNIETNKSQQYYQFSHPFFIRNREDLLPKVKRINTSYTLENSFNSYSDCNSDYSKNVKHPCYSVLPLNTINNCSSSTNSCQQYNHNNQLSEIVYKLQNEVDFLRQEMDKTKAKLNCQTSYIQKIVRTHTFVQNLDSSFINHSNDNLEFANDNVGLGIEFNKLAKKEPHVPLDNGEMFQNNQLQYQRSNSDITMLRNINNYDSNNELVNENNFHSIAESPRFVNSAEYDNSSGRIREIHINSYSAHQNNSLYY